MCGLASHIGFKLPDAGTLGMMGWACLKRTGQDLVRIWYQVCESAGSRICATLMLPNMSNQNRCCFTFKTPNGDTLPLFFISYCCIPMYPIIFPLDVGVLLFSIVFPFLNHPVVAPTSYHAAEEWRGADGQSQIPCFKARNVDTADKIENTQLFESIHTFVILESLYFPEGIQGSNCYSLLIEFKRRVRFCLLYLFVSSFPYLFIN